MVDYDDDELCSCKEANPNDATESYCICTTKVCVSNPDPDFQEYLGICVSLFSAECQGF